MPSINLLPWRVVQREQQKKRYLALLGTVAGMTFACVWLLGMGLEHLLSVQQTRNAFLQQEIAVLDIKIEKIKAVKLDKEILEQKMKLIEQLLISRNATPITIDELAQIIPDGIAFNELNRIDNIMILEGTSSSNNRLAAFMRALDDSPIFVAPEIASISADPNSAQGLNRFRLTFNIASHIAPRLIITETTGGAQ